MHRIKEFAEQNNISQGLILSGSGSISDFELSSTSKLGNYSSYFGKDAHKILAVSGSIRKVSEQFQASVRVSVAKPGLNPINGVIVKGSAVDGMELVIRKAEPEKIIVA